MEPTTSPASPEVTFLVNRRQDLEAQSKQSYETWMAINGAIQECNNSLNAIAKMQLERANDEKKAVPECMPENEDAI
jgi:hypothetical protein